VNGLGDYEIKSIQKVEDPCPIEVKKTVKQKQTELAQGKKKSRNLKDKERVLYAPFSNIGAMNFEKTTGYITIPDNQVVYTKLNEDGDQVGGVDASTGNEGQKLVWGLQDLKMALDEKEVEAPQLLQGITLEDEQDEAGLFSKLKKKKQQE
jgi:ribosome biogenesis protein BMS1